MLALELKRPSPRCLKPSEAVISSCLSTPVTPASVYKAERSLHQLRNPSDKATPAPVSEPAYTHPGVRSQMKHLSTHVHCDPTIRLSCPSGLWVLINVPPPRFR